MPHKLTKTLIERVASGIVLIITLTGCGIYEAIDERLHPTPQIGENPDYQINRYSDGRLSVDFSVSVIDGDMAMFYYSCKTNNGWDSDKEVGSQNVVDGRAEHFHVTSCDTQLMVQVVVYSNYRKRSQRHKQMAWLFDIEQAAQLY